MLVARPKPKCQRGNLSALDWQQASLPALDDHAKSEHLAVHGHELLKGAQVLCSRAQIHPLAPSQGERRDKPPQSCR